MASSELSLADDDDDDVRLILFAFCSRCANDSLSSDDDNPGLILYNKVKTEN